MTQLHREWNIHERIYEFRTAVFPMFLFQLVNFKVSKSQSLNEIQPADRSDYDLGGPVSAAIFREQQLQ